MPTTWNEVPDSHKGRWHSAFKECRPPYPLARVCPICGAKELRAWYQCDVRESIATKTGRFVGRGAVWEWCGACRTYRILGARVPEWWDAYLNSAETVLLEPPLALMKLRTTRFMP